MKTNPLSGNIMTILAQPSRPRCQWHRLPACGPIVHLSLVVLCCLVLTPACFAQPAGKGESLTARLEDVAMGDEFNSADAWRAQPGWLSNPSAQAGVVAKDGVACFTVPEPNRGMKWSRQTPGVSLDDMPYLVVRYRAENAAAQGDDYFIYLNDGKQEQCNALRLGDIVADGQWHTVAINARRLVARPDVLAMAIQLRSNRTGNVRLWMDWIMFSQRVPDGAAELRAAAPSPAAPDWAAPLPADWTAQPRWLSNPASQCETLRDAAANVFRVSDADRGMKWSWKLPAPVPLAGHRFLSFHYRAANYRPAGDYAVSILGKSRAGGDYMAIIPNHDIAADGRWHTLAVELDAAAARFVAIDGFAIQVQSAGRGPAELRVDRLALTSERPLKDLSEFVTIAPAADFSGFSPVSIAAACNQQSAVLRRRLGIGQSFPSGRVAVDGVPFDLPDAKTDLLCSSLDGQEELAIPVAVSASEVYLLTWAVFAGAEEPSRGSGRLRRLADVDRFRVDLEYADGSRSQCLPFNAGTRQFEIVEGPQVLIAWADPHKQLRRIVVRDLTAQGAFGIAGVTLRTAAERLFPQCAEETPPLRIAPRPLPAAQAPSAAVQGDRLTLSNAHLAMAIDLAPSPRIVSLLNRAARHDCLTARECLPLLSIGQSRLQPASPPVVKSSPDRAKAELHYRIAGGADVEAVLRIELGAAAEVAFETSLINRGRESASIGFCAPNVGAFCLGDDLDGNYYLLPKCGAAFHNAPASFNLRYCGHDMPLGFMSAVNPAAAEGLYLRTEDTTDLWRSYRLGKDAKGVAFGVDYPAQPLPAGGMRHAARTVLGIGGGDWRDGLLAYRRWLQSWYKPASPRQNWFREAFNFRQKFLWSNDPLCDRATGRWNFQQALAEGSDQFGGIEYLHLFDWGYCGKYGRIYGRAGDYSAYDFMPGGQEAFRRAIASVQQQGVRVGLYIEGYLLDERGKLGQSQGKKWQIVAADGRPLYWPQSTEMFMCPFASAWREVQAGTYAARVRELDVNGMYVDQFGFADAHKDCFSREHGHAVPGYTVVGERDCMKQIRDRVDVAKRGVVLYSEECPCDVNSQYQDGSFTYAMAQAARTQTLAPLNLLRFAIPSFKTFEILVCDKPMGDWAAGVKWTFFNGEGIWLEGPAIEWFGPRTLAAIRKCHAILRRHKDAFTSDAPEPLVPTEAGGVFANLFPIPGKRVYTLYNSRHRTFAGDVLRLPHVEGARYRDTWNECEITARRDGADDIIPITIDPQDVGCIVVETPVPAH